MITENSQTVERTCEGCGCTFDAPETYAVGGVVQARTEHHLARKCPKCKRARQRAKELRKREGGRAVRPLTMTCAWCGESFEVAQVGPIGAYCSEPCSKANGEAKAKARRHVRTLRLDQICQRCGTTFHHTRKQAVCPLCKSKPPERICVECGSSFPGKKTKKTCSTACRNARLRKQAQARQKQWKKQYEAKYDHCAADDQGGTLAEVLFDAFCISERWIVARPIQANAKNIDRVIKRSFEAAWEGVQVKLVRQERKGEPAVRCNRSGVMYPDGAFDLLAAVELETGCIWLLPEPMVRGVVSKALRSITPEGGAKEVYPQPK